MPENITAIITPSTRVNANVSIDSRDNKIVARSASIGDLSSITEAVLASLDFNNVDNTSDLDKPISTATQSALDTKADIVDTLWMALARGFTGIPSQIDTTTSPTTGVVYQYDYINGTRYRFIADDNSLDQFYSTYTSGTLSDLVAEKQISL